MSHVFILNIDVMYKFSYAHLSIVLYPSELKTEDPLYFLSDSYMYRFEIFIDSYMYRDIH